MKRFLQTSGGGTIIIAMFLRIVLVFLLSLPFIGFARTRAHAQRDQGANARPQADEKSSLPKIYLFSYGAKSGDTFTDDAVSQVNSFLESKERYHGCKLELQEYHDITPQQVSSLEKIAKNSLVIVNAHGQVKEGKFRMGSQESVTFLGEDLLKAIKESHGSLNVWLTTCSGGACPKDGFCVGSECGADESAYGDLPGLKKLIDIYCSAATEECCLWNRFDENRDGRLTQTELLPFLKYKRIDIGWKDFQGTSGKRPDGMTKYIKECTESPGGIATIREKSTVTLQFEQWGRSKSGEKEKLLSESTKVEEFEKGPFDITSRYPDWPKKCGKSRTGPHRKCSIKKLSQAWKVHCAMNSSNSGLGDYTEVNTPTLSVDFAISYDACKEVTYEPGICWAQ